MRDLPLGTVLRAALVAGLAAGLAVAAFHLLATEPVIDHAIALEAQLQRAKGTQEELSVSRAAQREGLVFGLLLYGLTWSLLFGAIYHFVQDWLPAFGALKRGLLLALLGYWSVALLPFLKYPANPPGAGDPNTVGYRMLLYLGMLMLSMHGTVQALALARADFGGWRLVPAFLVFFGVGVYLVMPDTPDAIHIPADVVATFRGLSLAGLTLFWAVLGLSFGLLLRLHEGGQARRPASAAPEGLSPYGA
jgi:predicted cobalt transporter CbtA